MASPRPHRSPQPIDRVLSPIQTFMAAEASAGILLLAMAAVAMIWANLPVTEQTTRDTTNMSALTVMYLGEGWPQHLNLGWTI